MTHNDTPRHIMPLPPEVVERIAAGEVIERPASVVRELIENALDAGATAIRVELRDGGLRLLRVSDNGWGIAPDDLALATQPHTTSKIHHLADLDAITTLGFRGEALASVAAIAELEITSATDDLGPAASLTLRPGHPAERSALARPRGTTVTVRDLFHTVPARRSLLRGPRSEAARALAVTRDYALAHPAIAFTLLDEGRQLLQTPGASLHDAIAHLYGADVAAALAPIGPIEIAAAHITGLVAARAFSSPTREHIVLALNGRPIANRALLAALEAGYRSALRKGRHPLLIVAISAPPDTLDVNVHPAKTDVLLRHETALAAALRDAVHRALGAAPINATTTSATLSPFASQLQLRLPTPRARRGLPLGAHTHRVIPNIHAHLPADDEPITELPALEALTQFEQTLILARSPAGHLYLVDQHRAHERILYERLQRQRAAAEATPISPAPDVPAPASQLLLEPLLLELTPHQAALLAPRLDELAALGLICQPFGGGVFLVRALPHLAGAEATQQPADLARALADDASADSADWLEYLCQSLACRSAIRRGQPLTLPEQQQLLTDLRATSAPSVCPHGSPLALRYTRAFLTRAFEW